MVCENPQQHGLEWRLFIGMGKWNICDWYCIYLDTRDVECDYETDSDDRNGFECGEDDFD